MWYQNTVLNKLPKFLLAIFEFLLTKVSRWDLLGHKLGHTSDYNWFWRGAQVSEINRASVSKQHFKHNVILRDIDPRIDSVWKIASLQ